MLSTPADLTPKRAAPSTLSGIFVVETTCKASSTSAGVRKSSTWFAKSTNVIQRSAEDTVGADLIKVCKLMNPPRFVEETCRGWAELWRANIRTNRQEAGHKRSCADGRWPQRADRGGGRAGVPSVETRDSAQLAVPPK